MFPLPFFEFCGPPQALRASSPKGTPLRYTGNFTVTAKSRPLGQTLPGRGEMSRQRQSGERVSKPQALTEGVTPAQSSHPTQGGHTMKHCAKKLLGLAFALALCLAVGGTALAETPEFADVPAALPEQEMLAYEPNVTTAAGENIIDKFATDGYTVTIPTTVEVKSTTDTGTLEVKGELEVTAVMKQWRTLSIKIEPQTPTSGAWTLKYNGNASAGTTLPQVEYNLPEGYAGEYEVTGFKWLYEDEYKQLSFYTQKLGGTEEVSQTKTITAKLAVTVPHPEQATMSGTYSDILTFRITPNKTCVTYNINVYEQELKLADDGKSVEAVDMVDTDGNVIGNPTPKLTKTFEYPLEDKDYKWTYSSDDPEDDKLRWQELPTVTMNADKDNKAGKPSVTFNLNLKRKWYWLDVNGATDYTDADVAGGNQGDHIGSFVEIMLSVDGVDWTPWFWQGDGDDYWQQLPYGIHFKLGLHHVKNGYVYDTGTGTLKGSGVRIIANKEEKYTATGEPVNGSTYYVYTGEMTGEPTGTDGVGNLRYCYIPCYKKGLTYIANDGTGGTESVNTGNPPRSNVLYEDGGTLKKPEDLKIIPPTGKSFAGWSTKSTYTTGDTLYQPGELVSNVTWDGTYEGKKLDERPYYQGTQDTQKRELYAIWGYDIKVEFEDKTGYTEDGTSTPVLGGTMEDKYSFTLKGQLVDEDKGWTLDWNDPDVQEKIIDASIAAKSDTWIEDALDNETATGDELAEKIWKIGSHTEGGHTFDFTKECTLSAAKVKSGEPLVIQRRRYLLSVISAEIDTDDVHGIATDPLTTQYGTFTVTVNGVDKVSNTSFYQCGLNYGAKYEIKDVAPKEGYNPKAYMVFKLSLKKGTTQEQDGYQAGAAIPKSNGESYSGFMTAKRSNIHYYTNGGNSSTDIYTGDPVRIGFMNMVSSSKPGSTTPMPGPSLAPAKKALTLRYHANFDPTEELALDLDPDPLLDDMDDTFGFDPDPLPEDVDDALEGAVKTVSYRPGEDVVLRNCMFKRGGYVFAGWNTEPDGTGKGYEVDGVPRTDWAAGDTVDLYAQWKKPEHLKPVVDDEPFVPADPDTPPEWVDDVFGVDPDPQPEDADTAFGVDPAAQPDELDAAFGVDPDPQPEELDDAFGVDPDPLPDELDDAFSV